MEDPRRNGDNHGDFHYPNTIADVQSSRLEIESISDGVAGCVGVLIRHKFGASSEGVDNERDPHDWLTISESTVLAEMTPIQRTQKTSDSARTELWLSVRR